LNFARFWSKQIEAKFKGLISIVFRQKKCKKINSFLASNFETIPQTIPRFLRFLSLAKIHYLHFAEDGCTAAQDPGSSPGRQTGGPDYID
jgi:hypothetical protein